MPPCSWRAVLAGAIAGFWEVEKLLVESAEHSGGVDEVDFKDSVTRFALLVEALHRLGAAGRDVAVDLVIVDAFV